MDSLIRIMVAAAMLGIGLVAFRSMAWSCDSPVLRKAMRNARFSRNVYLGLGVTACVVTWVLFRFGDGQLSAATLVFGAMFSLFGAAGVLFVSLVMQDVREVFIAMAASWVRNESFVHWNDRPRCHAANRPERTCLNLRTCQRDVRPCGSGGFSIPWRPADRQRNRQRR